MSKDNLLGLMLFVLVNVCLYFLISDTLEKRKQSELQGQISMFSKVIDWETIEKDRYTIKYLKHPKQDYCFLVLNDLVIIPAGCP